ncbi:glycosyltransferase [Actinoplanes sp. NPDC051851]|uniref:glycosyltransferase n=1 Tax=Actinoplanes sp. NPDC051851 TaxID=3154753 RepID=UPI0034396288
MVALAVRLREQGAEVRVCAPDDDEFGKRLHGVGVPFTPIGQSVRALVTGERRPTAAGVPERAAALIGEQFAKLPDVAAGADVIVAAGILPSVLGVRSVADGLGIPYVYTAFQPTSLPSPFHPPIPRPGHPLPEGVTDNGKLWALDAENANALFRDALNARRAAAGLAAVENVRDYGFTDGPWLACDPLLAPWPDSGDLDVVQTGAWVTPDDRPLPAEVEEFLDAGDPPVYIGFGSTTPKFPDLSANFRYVVARGWAAPRPESPRCLVVDEVNHQALFPRVSAVVHHGGAGTTTAAALAGVPQVILPQGGDQPYWGSRVEALGIGAVGPLDDALTIALAPETFAHAAAVAAAMYPDGALAAAQTLIEEYRP